MKSNTPGSLDFIKFKHPKFGLHEMKPPEFWFHEIQAFESLDFMKFKLRRLGFHKTLNQIEKPQPNRETSTQPGILRQIEKHQKTKWKQETTKTTETTTSRPNLQHQKPTNQNNRPQNLWQRYAREVKASKNEERQTTETYQETWVQIHSQGYDSKRDRFRRACFRRALFGRDPLRRACFRRIHLEDPDQTLPEIPLPDQNGNSTTGSPQYKSNLTTGKTWKRPLPCHLKSEIPLPEIPLLCHLERQIPLPDPLEPQDCQDTFLSWVRLSKQSWSLHWCVLVTLRYGWRK